MEDEEQKPEPAAARSDALPCVPPEHLLTTGDLARDCGTTVRTVRFYEEAGLVEPTSRSYCGHRMYEPAQRDKLHLIMDLREAGVSLQDIRKLFELKRKSATPEEASRAMAATLEEQVEALQRKIGVLRRLREELASMVAVIRECESCGTPAWRRACASCDVFARPDLPRAMRLLWTDPEEETA